MIQRVRKLTAADFLTQLAFWKSDTIGYPDIASDLTAFLGETISHQAVAQKMKKSQSFFQTVAMGAIENSKVAAKLKTIEVNGVRDILLADSTTIALRNSLADVFPGTGGNGPKASVKLHAMFNMTSQTVAYLSIAEGTTSEHSFKEAHAVVAKEGDLIIRDLGFFDAEDLNSLGKSGRFFLSRIPLSVKAFTNETGEIVNLWKNLSKSNRFSYDDFLVVGGNGILTRVVAVRLPKHRWKERLAQLRKEKGRPLTTTEKTQAKWNLLVTNLSREQASVQTLVSLYALRWQIELLFKAWKSCLGVDRIKQATCKPVVIAFIWARLTYAVFMCTIRRIVEAKMRCEIGLIRWYRRLGTQLPRMREMIRGEKWLAIAKLIRDVVIPYSLPEKSHRSSSLEKAKDFCMLDLNLGGLNMS